MALNFPNDHEYASIFIPSGRIRRAFTVRLLPRMGGKTKRAFHCDGRPQRLGGVPGRTSAGQDAEPRPLGCLRGSLRQCPLSGSRLQPFHTAVFTGISPRFGLYRNEQKMRGVMPGSRIIAQDLFLGRATGRVVRARCSTTSSTLLRGTSISPEETENPFPETLGPPKRPVSLPRGGPGNTTRRTGGDRCDRRGVRR